MQKLEHSHTVTISQLADAPTPAGLRAAILTRIFALRRRAALTRAAFLTGVAAVSALLLWDTFAYTFEEATASGFIDYARLLVTDSDMALSLWREFGTAIVSSAPLIPVALACAVAILFMWSMERLYQNVRVVTIHNKRFA